MMESEEQDWVESDDTGSNKEENIGKVMMMMMEEHSSN